MYTHTHSHMCPCTHTTLRSGHPPTFPSCPRLSWHQGCPKEASVMGTAPGRRGSTLMVPRGRGWGCLCPAASCPNICWHPPRVPGPRDGPSPRPLQADLPRPPQRGSHDQPGTSLQGPRWGECPSTGLCPQAVSGNKGWGRHSRWQKRKHGFSLTSLNGRRAGLCRAGRGWISHLERTRSQGSLPHFFLEECWKFWWPGMEKENLRTLKSFTASGVEAFTQARW